MNKKRYLLTDFNRERWNGVDMESVKNQIDKIKQKSSIHGEIGFTPIAVDMRRDVDADILLSNVSHIIDNITLEGKKVYGDVLFLQDGNGKLAKNKIENLNCQFGIRSFGTNIDNIISIKEIITWDVVEKFYTIEEERKEKLERLQ